MAPAVAEALRLLKASLAVAVTPTPGRIAGLILELETALEMVFAPAEPAAVAIPFAAVEHQRAQAQAAAHAAAPAPSPAQK